MRFLSPFLAFFLLLATAGQAAPAPVSPAEQFPLDSRRWSQSASAVVHADFSLAQPAAALTKGPAREKGKWKLVPFTTAELKGWALTAYAYTGAPTVRLPLSASGWHAVYVGTATTTNGFKEGRNGVRAKLGREPVFRRMSTNVPLQQPGRRDVIQEQFLTVAKIDGDALELAQMAERPTTICYVKLVPLTEAEVTAWNSRHAPENRKTRNNIATFDGHTWIWPYHPRTTEELLENFRGYEDSDIGKWWFQILGADLTIYPTKVGNNPGAGTTDFSSRPHEDFYRSLQALFAKGINPLRVAREAARAQGAEFHVMIRPAGWKMAMPYEETFNSKFFDAHPEWHCLDRDGTPTLHMSYAVPEVRQHLLDVLREALEVQPEGVGFLFNRGMPLMLWEPAFCARFQQQHGEDARTVAETDPRLTALRADIMTEFFTQVRALLDETARAQGRTVPYRISMATFSKEDDNVKFGLDVPRWIAKGLVDEIGIAWFAVHTSFATPDVAYYKRITAGSKVKVYPFVVSWKAGKAKELTQKVTSFYAAGADGIAIWDPVVEAGWTEPQPGNIFDTLSRLGHREDVARWVKTGVPLPLVIPLTMLDGNHYSRWHETGF